MYTPVNGTYVPDFMVSKLSFIIIILLSFLSVVINGTKDGYGLTFTEINDFMSKVTENYDPELYNIHFKKHVLENYGDTIQFCPSYRVNTP